MLDLVEGSVLYGGVCYRVDIGPPCIEDYGRWNTDTASFDTFYLNCAASLLDVTFTADLIEDPCVCVCVVWRFGSRKYGDLRSYIVDCVAVPGLPCFLDIYTCAFYWNMRATGLVIVRRCRAGCCARVDRSGGYAGVASFSFFAASVPGYEKTGNKAGY